MYTFTEEVLVDGLKLKDSKVFTYLYDSFAPALMANIMRLVKCPSNAEDILQIVFMKIWDRGDQYQPSKGRLFTWMINISRNTTIDYLRHQQTRPHEYGTTEVGEITQKTCAVHKRMLRFDVRRMMSILPQKDRGMLELVMAGFTCKEIGKLLHIPESTVKTRLQSAYRKCRLASDEAI